MSTNDPPRWEYRTLRPPRESTKKEASDPVDELNDLGAEGWEVVETIDYVGGGTKFLLLKRPESVGREGQDG
ncbi:hypothetical protein HUG10_12955 [Halorarum halophilum]|uniref:DUF4177 domain-containing protein n=1 Tax=Halorarum halophilum TaxID=2743090 RepID=A0A7D5KV48_9EURY|nr:hypothetical protein [Halobaculum halophilum]QLG28400.1 hypothetical protein HUG10_12955 [Halobaculum halophilum]